MPGYKPLPESELEWNFTASSGPGGQNVNKTATKAQLRWKVLASNVYSEQEKNLLYSRLVNYLNSDGEVMIQASESRSQLANKHEALRKLESLIERALTPIKRRRPTRPTKASQLRRRQAKARRSQVKQARKLITD